LQDTLPDYADVERALERANCGFSAAESHGMGCGLLVVNQAADQNAWLVQVLEGDPQDFHLQEARNLLRELFILTRQQMNDGDLGFELFLPDTDDLGSRVEAMQDWCQGFAFGIAAAGVKDMKKLPTDSREWAEDVMRIGTSGEFDLDDEEESESAFVELVEYLRVGVLMMNEEMQPMKTSPQVH
jgi:yecA family protein